VNASGNVYLQKTFGEEALPFWQLVTHLGDGALLFLLVLIFTWLIDFKAGLRIGWIGSLIGVVVGLLKLLIQDPRPYYVSADVQAWAPGTGFGMPSGHAAAATGVYCAICVSRVYLGVHTPLQVIAGVIVGITFVAFCCWLDSHHHNLLFPSDPLELKRATLVLGLASFIIITAFVFLTHFASRTPVPELWQLRYQEALAVESGLAIGPGNELNVSKTGLHYIIALFLGTWLAMLLATRWLPVNDRPLLHGIQLIGIVVLGLFSGALLILLAAAIPQAAVSLIVVAALPTGMFVVLPGFVRRL